MRDRIFRIYVERRLPRRLPARRAVVAVAASRPARWCYGRIPGRRRRSADARTTPTVH